jgi:hypothetical protein
MKGRNVMLAASAVAAAVASAKLMQNSFKSEAKGCYEL